MPVSWLGVLNLYLSLLGMVRKTLIQGEEMKTIEPVETITRGLVYIVYEGSKVIGVVSTMEQANKIKVKK